MMNRMIFLLLIGFVARASELPDGPGLCIHLGASEKTVEWVAGSRRLVHGLAADDAAVARARQAIAARGLTGQAMVEKWPGPTLPYVDNLANVVIVDAPVAEAEVMRVLAPGGVAIYPNRQVVKPWPAGMDDWTHPTHGPDGNRVSQDKLVRFPAGMRWQDGVPMNFNAWAAVRGWVIAGGRVFSLGTTELENIAPDKIRQFTDTEYVTARDAFNGLPLWKVNLGTRNDGKALTSRNPAAIATDGRQVFVYQKDRLVALDAATGEVRQHYAVKFPTVRLALADGVLVAAGWPERALAKEEELGKVNGLWAPWVNNTGTGEVAAFDVAGKAKWSMELAAQDLLVNGGKVFVLCQQGNPATEQTVVALDLGSGRQLWRATNTEFACLNSAGEGVVVLNQLTKKKILVLGADSGEVLWEADGPGKGGTPFVDGLLWAGASKFDPRTGAAKGVLAIRVGDGMCTPACVVGDQVISSRGAGTVGNRGSCIQGLTPAAGMLFTAQNNCRCTPSQLPGFLALGPSGAPADFQAARPVERFEISNLKFEIGPEEWPTYRHDAARSGTTMAKVQNDLKILWSTQVAAPAPPALAAAWNARLVSPVSAPVVAGGRVFATDVNRGTVTALEAATGKLVWRTTVGSRVDGPPTVQGGLCIFGAHDGWVYALRASDGRLAWRTRAAPAERRMVAFGAVESVWPVIGPVAALGNTIYATAGRNTDVDGGVATVALDAATGRPVWVGNIAGAKRQNDLLRVVDGQLAMHQVRIDPATGATKELGVDKKEGLAGWIDGTWTRIGTRRSGRLKHGDAIGELLAWDEQMVFGYDSEPKTRGLFALVGTNTTWRAAIGAQEQPEALLLAADTLVVAGRTGTSGFLWLMSAAEGQRRAELALPAPPTYDGLAVTDGRIYLSLQDGSVVCLSAPSQAR